MIARNVPAGSVLLAYPNAQEPNTAVVVAPETRSMLWQAVAGMRFRMIGAHAAQPERVGLRGDQLFADPPAVQRFLGWAYYGPGAVPDGGPSAQLPQLLREFCLRNHVDTVVVDLTAGVDPMAVVRYVSLALGRPPQQLSGIDAWFGIDRALARGSVAR